MTEQRSARILIAEDEANLRLVLQKELERLGYRVQAAPDGEAALRKLEETNVDVLLCDINMPRVDGMEVLRRVHERPNPPEVIMLTGQATVETAVEAMKLGAYDYLTKPYTIDELDVRVKQAAEKRHLRVDNLRLREQLARQSGLPNIVSVSESMREVVRLVERVAPSEASVLITGESGTGKELIAHAIHRLSNRSEGSFIDINCAAFQESLLESELFGYEAGAFSGAKGRKLGLIELADGGTLFLDEVTELPAQLQAKLLRAIETRTFFRVGGVRKVEVNVRIVAATNRNLETVVGDGSFRSDLLYRINGFQIDLSPLRERSEDIEPLTRFLLSEVGGTSPPELEQLALDALKSYSWPGNVRQLKNTLERAVILSNNGKITVNELPPEVVRPSTTAAPVFSAPMQTGTAD
ncbi:MAG TPA: sigma-54 dependent transcriptional regulator, partial [Pyrinomonadaceae bacterium]